MIELIYTSKEKREMKKSAAKTISKNIITIIDCDYKCIIIIINL